MTRIITLLVLIALLAPQLQFGVDGQTRRQQPSPAPAVEQLILKSIRNEKLAEPYVTGQLPEPLRKPDGQPDQVAALLARQAAKGDDQSVPALLTAIMTAGFGVRDTDGGLTQTVQPGHGLIFDAWEVASMAKMYGERRTVELAYLADSIKLIPELKQAPLEKIIVDGIRKHASSRQPELRFWARFIVELGKRAPQPYDLLNDKNIRLDAIQSALILRRVLGDLYTLAQPPQQALKKRFYAHAPQTQPCTMSDMEATIADVQALATTTAFGELLSWVKDKIGGSSGDLFGKYSKLTNILNILLAYAKFIATYAALETEITVENPPLVRNTSTSAG